MNYYRNEIIRVAQKIIKYEKTERPYKYLNKSELMLVVNLISVQQRKRRSFIFLWSCCCCLFRSNTDDDWIQ